MRIHYRQEVARKIVHLSSLWMVAFIYFYPKLLCVVLFGALALLGIIAEYGYHKKWPFFYPLYSFFFKRILRTEERAGKAFKLSGGNFVILSALLATLCLSMENAVIALSIMLIGDTAASLIGRHFGTVKVCGNKSLQGSFAFLFVSIIIVMAWGLAFKYDAPHYAIAMAAAVLATIAEMVSGKTKLDDNLLVVIGAGAILSFNELLY